MLLILMIKQCCPSSPFYDSHSKILKRHESHSKPVALFHTNVLFASTISVIWVSYKSAFTGAITAKAQFQDQRMPPLATFPRGTSTSGDSQYLAQLTQWCNLQIQWILQQILHFSCLCMCLSSVSSGGVPPEQHLMCMYIKVIAKRYKLKAHMDISVHTISIVGWVLVPPPSFIHSSNTHSWLKIQNCFLFFPLYFRQTFSCSHHHLPTFQKPGMFIQWDIHSHLSFQAHFRRQRLKHTHMCHLWTFPQLVFVIFKCFF